MKKKEYNFGEMEYDRYKGKKIPVTILSKYTQTKEKVIALLEDDKYSKILNESDFWILKNYDNNGDNCFYSGLIITHDALIKINDSLDDNLKFNQMFCSDPVPTTWNGTEGFRIEYRDKRDGMIEYGEVSIKNCKNEYPFAMLLKRVFDRVVKRKANLYMVYSDSEADEFRVAPETKEEVKATDEQVDRIIAYKEVILDELMARNITRPSEVQNLSIKEASVLCEMIDKRLNGEVDG
jgi:hypothetical protein